jgi:hypothetical protein
MPSRSPLGRHSVIAGTLIAAVLAVGAPAAQASSASKSFQPVQQSSHTATFRPASLDSGKIESAKTLLRKRGHTVARPLSVGIVRHAIESSGTVTIHKPARSRAVSLQVTIDESASTGSNDPTGPAGTTTTPSGSTNPTSTSPTSTSPATPANDPKPSGSCGVDASTMTGVGCNVLRNDTSATVDPNAGLWGSIDCANSSRYQFEQSGGDPTATATGESQGNDAFRALTALDGDDYYGERCELGHNSSRYGINRASQTNGTFNLYEDGQQRVTFFSERYPDNFSTQVNAWQTIMQMKQAQPADNAGMGPVLELQLYGGKLRLQNSWHQMWTTNAPDSDKWIRYAMDVNYSTDPNVGSVQVYVDLNGDGDFLDSGEQSPLLHMQTLLVETDGPNGTSDGLAPGDAIPDHLRLGLYHNPSIACPPPSGCSVDVDNVQVVG